MFVRVCWFAVLLLVVFAPAPSAAQEQKGLPQKDLCVPEKTGTGGTRYVLKMERLIAWMFEKENPIGWQCVSLDGKTDYDSRAQLLLSSPFDPGRKCSDQDRVNYFAARSRLSGLVQGLVPGLVPEKVMTDARPLSELNAADLLKQHSGLVIVCTNVKGGTEAAEADKGSAGGISSLNVGGWKVKLRGDQDSLAYDNKEDDYKKKATSAQVSIVDNQLTDRTRFNVKGTVGLDSGPSPFEVANFGAGSYRLIPYVKLEQQFNRPEVAKPKSADEREIDTRTLGLIGTVFFRPDALPLVSKFTFDPQYIEDEQVGSRLFGTTVKWYPTFLYAGGAKSFPAGTVPVGNLFYYNLDFLAVARIAEVLDPGIDPTLIGTKDFAYYGGEARLILTGKADFLEPFKLDLRYHYLWREHGPDVVPERFTASLTYSLSKDGNVDIGVTWDGGRDYETLQRRGQVTTSLGYKF